ncbi:MAG: bacteriohemerythrin [Campylobacteraceae bacterium]
MAYWDWNSSYEIGLPVIDKQHQRIIEYINELHEALVSNNTAKLPEILISLKDYTVSHFAFEETLMEQAGYPLTAPHKKVHEAFIKTVEKYFQRYKDGEDIVGQLMAELQIWLTHHILNDDKDYKDSIQKMLLERKNVKKEEPKKSWFQRLFG